ncbi:MAG TPA: alkaline phosphatase family protein, partial [Kofleriaceae bacterium]|nr:alkaline phosphatase family protein [Kofleriaceae bacterium]
MINRRDAIKQIGGLAGAAAMAKYLPGCGGSSGPNGIKNYVFMMMENRSYDHYFGARKLVEGLDGDGLAMTMTNPDLAGNPIAPWNPNMDQMCDLDPPHDWDDAHNSFNNGAMDGFVKADQMDHSMPDLIDPMQYLTRDQLPVSWALADAYTTCDRWFCSVMGPTWPNRFYWHTGSSGGLMSNELPSAGYLPWPSIYNNL